MRRLVASFPDMIAVLDSEGLYTFVSQRVTEVLGRSPEYYIGDSLERHTNAEDKERLNEMFQSLIRGKVSHGRSEIRMLHADSGVKFLRLSACPLFDESGTITGVVASARDVTESRLADQQVAQREKFTAMGRMMAGAAHELNNPLTAILGVGELLRERATDEGTRRHLDLVLQQARRAASIVQSLTAFSMPHRPACSTQPSGSSSATRISSPGAAKADRVRQVSFAAPGPDPHGRRPQLRLDRDRRRVLADCGLRCTDVVVAGSPGMTVDDLRELHLTRSHFFSEEAPGDAIAESASLGPRPPRPRSRAPGCARTHRATSR